MKSLVFVLIIVFSNSLRAQEHYPPKVVSVLKKAGKNHLELERALQYFYKKGDSLQIRAIDFLITNMDIHYSVSYFWCDSSGARIDYNELDYADFETAINAFEALKMKHSKIYPKQITYRDIDSIRADLLIENVELAFKSWYRQKESSRVSFDDFCEYILPYRVSVEPIQDWRRTYLKRFDTVINIQQELDSQLLSLGKNIKLWFLNTYGIEERREPLPRLGALQLLSRAKGPCEDISDLASFILRSQGLMGTCDFVTFWGTSSGMHFCNGTYNSKHELIRFDASTANVSFEKFAREPAKVIRTTYSNRSETIANKIPTEQIPKGFLQTKNYIDVTQLYWPVDTFNIESFTKNAKILYASVFNYGNWHPTWWSSKMKNTFLFSNMSKGVVYLPVSYANKKISAAYWPVVLGYNNTLRLKPDTVNKIRIIIPEKAGYLLYRIQKKYTLYFWNNKWVKHSWQKISEGENALTFESVPSNALYILVPEYTQLKERPFIVDKAGKLEYY